MINQKKILFGMTTELLSVIEQMEKEPSRSELCKWENLLMKRISYVSTEAIAHGISQTALKNAQKQIKSLSSVLVPKKPDTSLLKELTIHFQLYLFISEEDYLKYEAMMYTFYLFCMVYTISRMLADLNQSSSSDSKTKIEFYSSSAPFSPAS